MSIRPAISVPLPWLAFIFGKASGKRGGAEKRRRFLRLPRSLSITREGKWFIGILILIGTAAINTGNNLLYLVAATLLSLIIISGIISESTLRGVTAELELPRRVFKGRPAAVRVRVRNRKLRIPSYSFNVSAAEAAISASPSLYVLKLAPGGEAEGLIRHTFARRGLFKLQGVKISTRFPFGLFIKGKEEPSSAEVVVYPSVRPKGAGAPRPSAMSRGGISRSKKGAGAQLFGLRDYTLQDDARYIHWKSAARLNKLLTKEFEEERERIVRVEFDDYSTEDPDVFEDAVDEAAAAAHFYIGKGYSVGLKTLGSELQARPGSDQLHKILYTLALIEPAGGKGVPRVKVITG